MFTQKALNVSNFCRTEAKGKGYELENLKSLLKNSICRVLEKLAEMAYTVCHASISMASFICYHSNQDVTLISK